jgi:hypothetical protein
MGLDRGTVCLWSSSLVSSRERVDPSIRFVLYVNSSTNWANYCSTRLLGETEYLASTAALIESNRGR